MYLFKHTGLGFLRILAITVRQKEVQTLDGNLMNNSDNMAYSANVYESEGRAFESLRVHHFPPVCGVLKNWFVPLIGICTSFFANQCSDSTPYGYTKSTCLTANYPKRKLRSLSLAWIRRLIWKQEGSANGKPDGLISGSRVGCYKLIKLMSIEEAQAHCDFLEPFTKRTDGAGAVMAREIYPLYKQLLDTMRENERLRAAINNAYDAMHDKMIGIPYRACLPAYDILSNEIVCTKTSDNG